MKNVFIHSVGIGFSIVILEVIHNEDAVICVDITNGKPGKRTRNRIYEDSRGRFFIMKHDTRYFLQDFLNTEVSDGFPYKKQWLQKGAIFFDMDGCLAEWRPDAAYEDLFQNGYFRTLMPTKLAECADSLSQTSKTPVCTLSAYFPQTNALEEKKSWLSRHTPNIPAERQFFIPVGSNKAALMRDIIGRDLTPRDVLIDDHTPNLIEWREAGGCGIKWLNGINGNGGTWDGMRVDNCKELRKALVSALGIRKEKAYGL